MFSLGNLIVLALIGIAALYLWRSGEYTQRAGCGGTHHFEGVGLAYRDIVDIGEAGALKLLHRLSANRVEYGKLGLVPRPSRLGQERRGARGLAAAGTAI
jgi:hypothetical protein